MLKTLSLYPISDDDYSDRSSEVIRTFENAANLRNLAIYQLTIDRVVMPWSQIREFTLDGCDTGGMDDIDEISALIYLCHLPNVERVTFSVVSSASTSLESLGHFEGGQVVSQLQGLELISVDYDILFQLLRCPLLTSLTIKGRSSTIHDPIEADIHVLQNAPKFDDFISSCKHLTSLKISNIALLEEYLIGILRLISNLTCLDLGLLMPRPPEETVGIGARFFQSMTVSCLSNSPDAQMLLPKLTSFYLSGFLVMNSK